MEETTVWKGSSSQVVNLGTYVLCGLFFWLVVPIFIGVWKWIENTCRVYEVTTQRIKISHGVFTRRTDELELYRVKDTTLVEPFLLRVFGTGNVVMTTVDASTPTVTLEALRDAQLIREEVRKNIEACRDRKRVRVAELE